MKSPRIPQQARGHIRYQKILTAAVVLMEKLKSSNFTMQDLASEADTSIGSLYHFFKYKKDLLSVLTSKHTRFIMDFYLERDKIPDVFWKDCAPNEVIEEAIMPALRYISSNPDFLVLIRENQFDLASEKNIHSQVLKFFKKIIGIRQPKFSDKEIEVYAQMLIALPAGPLSVDQKELAFSDTMLLREIPRALSSYRHYWSQIDVNRAALNAKN